MELKDYIKLFDRYDVYTLYSLGFLLTLAKDLDLFPNAAVSRLIAKKMEEDKDNFEGMEEYDDLTIMHNFDITEIMDDLGNLNSTEFNYLRSLAEKAIKNTKEMENIDEEVKTHLEVFVERCNYEEVSSYKENIDSDFTDKELKALFNKYSAQELESFKLIFTFALDIDLRRISNIYNEVLDSKLEELRKEYSVPVTPLGYRISSLATPTKSLNSKELGLLARITESSSMCLESVADKLDYRYEYKEVSNLNDSLDKEIANRKLMEAKDRGFTLNKKTNFYFE